MKAGNQVFSEGQEPLHNNLTRDVLTTSMFFLSVTNISVKVIIASLDTCERKFRT